MFDRHVILPAQSTWRTPMWKRGTISIPNPIAVTGSRRPPAWSPTAAWREE